jgi:hypothetical protein
VPAVVICFRFDSSAPATDYAPAAALARDAQAIGGAVCAFLPGASGEIAFAFDPADAEAAVLLAANAVAASFSDEAVSPHDHRLRLLRAGVAQGNVETFLRGDAVRLAWGSAVSLASTLAARADDGDILLVAEMPAVAGGTVRVDGPALEVMVDGKVHACRALVVSDPLTAPLPPRSVKQLTPPPAASAHSGPQRQATGSFQLLELAREALVKADDVPLDDIVAALKLTVDNAEVVERLAGVLAMTRGAKEEGLRMLRRGAESENREDKRARAVLAYAIGVAAAGRHEDSLLEALTALATTRALGDKSGEKACARFLSRLSAATGHADAASAWEHVALRADPDAADVRPGD